MMTIQKPKRMWQKRKDYNKKKLIRKIQRRNKTSFDDGKDRSYRDWKIKASKYKRIDIDRDNTYDYEGWYNSDPDNAYNFLNNDPEAHFDDAYKTVYHPTFSDLSIYSGKIDPRFNPEGLEGGHWANDHKYISPKKSPVSMDERINYVNMGEDNGLQIRTPENKPLWMDDGTRYDGVLPNVIVKPKRNVNKRHFDEGSDAKVDRNGAPITKDSIVMYGTPEQIANSDTLWEYPKELNDVVVTPKGSYPNMQAYIAATHGSAYDPDAPFEMFNQLVFNSAPALFDTAYQGVTGQYGKQGAPTPTQDVMGYIYKHMAPSRWLGSAKNLLLNRELVAP